ncbi:MAG: hypothetical protein ACREOI_07355 [bacterium]
MEEALLLKELKAILDESKRRGINVFVIGAFCVKAYDSLIRESYDLDLAVVGEIFDLLAQLLKELGFSVHPRNIWVTAEKQIGEENIAIHIAVNEILDLNSQNSFSIRDEKTFFLKPGELDFEIPALSLSGLLITKLISFRENDVVDIVSLLTNKFEELNSQELYLKAADSNNLQAIQHRLLELRELFESDEIDAIWYIRLNRTLSVEVKAALLDKISKLLNPFSKSN